MSPFDYSRLMESTDDRRHMFGLVAKESEKDLAELEEALRKTDREAMRRIVHRMAPVWEVVRGQRCAVRLSKNSCMTGSRATRRSESTR